MESIFYKDPTAELDFAMDWKSTWLAVGESISSYDATYDGSGLTISTHAESSGVVTVWLAGGYAGSNYKVSIRIGTDASRIDERSFMVKVRER